MKWLLPLVAAIQLQFMQATGSTDGFNELYRMDPQKLDLLLDERLEDLQTDVFRMYKEQLRNHQENLNKMERIKRQTYDTVAVLPSHTSGFGHSYTYDTGVGNREVIVIDSMELIGYVGSLTITDVFPLQLANLTAIYKAQDGFGYVLVDGALQVLKVRNEWTKTTTGCRCDGSSPPSGRSHENCACCVPGACLCKYALGFNGDSCVPCGTETQNCPEAGPKKLLLDAAVGFEYVVPTVGLKQILITAKATVVSFYEFDRLDLQVVHSATGLSTLTSVHPVTHLGYGESYVNHYGILKKKRFLITFSAGQQIHQLHELSVGSSDTAISAGLSTIWKAKGSAMKASQSGGRLMITVLDGDRLQVYELKEDLWREFKFLRIQRLSLLGPVIAWGTFATGFENYLYLVSRTSIRIYIQNGLYYNSLTSINVDEDIREFKNLLAINWLSCRNEVVLLAGSGARLLIYTFDRTVVPNILRKVKVYNLQFEDTLWHLSFGYSQESGIRLLLPGPSRPVLFNLVTHLEEVEDFRWQENLIVENTINKFNDEYRLQSAIKSAAEEKLRNSVDLTSNLQNINANITITQSLMVSQTLVTNVLVANTFSFPGVDIGGSNLNDYTEYLNRFNSSRNRVDGIINRLEDFEKKLGDAINGQVSGSQIGGTLTIINPRLDLQTLITNNVAVSNPLDRDGSVTGLDNNLRNLVRLRNDVIVSGSKKFVNGIVVGELNLNFLDDIPVGDLVVERGDQDIEGAIYSSIFFAKEILLRPGALIAGIDITKAVKINDLASLGHVIIQSIEVENLFLSDLINSVNLASLFQDALLLTGGEVTGSLAVNREILISSLDVSEIMGIRISSFLNNAVFKNKDSVVKGRLTVGGRVVVRNVRLDGKLNDRSFDYPVRKSNTPIVFGGQKRFSNVKFDILNFGPQGNVDGISPGKLITKSTSQIISEIVFGQGVDIRQNLEIRSNLLDGVNLAEISRGLSQLPTSNPWVFDVVFVGPVTAQRLLYSGLVNGVDFSAFSSELLYDDSSITVFGIKRFLSRLSGRNVQIKGSLNGEDIDSLITTTKNHLIGGLKTFVQYVYLNSATSVFVDGVNMADFLSSALELNKDGQVVIGKKVFTNSVFISALGLSGKLSSVDFSNVMTKNTDQTFIAEQIFNSAAFGDLMVKNIKLNGFSLNGINLSDLAARRLSLKTSVAHTGTLVIDGPVSVVGNLMVDSINGISIQEIENNIVTDSRNSTISGPVIINNIVSSGAIDTLNRRGANGISLHDLFSRAAKLSKDGQFVGEIYFADMEVRGSINVNGLVNGVNLATLRDDAVYINFNGYQVVAGNKLFLNGFNVKGNINSETTNGVDLSRRLFTLNTDQQTSADYHFENIVVKKNVHLTGRFRDIDLRNLINLVTNTQSRYGSINFNGNVKVSELVINGEFNGRNLLALLSDAVRVRDGAVFVTGKKSFTASTQFTSLTVSSLNDVNLGEFLNNVILRSTDKVVIRPMTINGILSAPWTTAENLLVEGVIDRIDYRALLRDAVYITGQENLQSELIFEESLVVEGNVIAAFLNGRSLLRDYLTLTTEQSVLVNSNIATVSSSFVEVGGSVNGVYLPDLKELTMQAIDGQTITGTTVIKGTTKVLGNIEVTGKTGREVKIKLRSEVLNLSDGGELSGFVRLNSAVTSSLSSSSYLINGLNLAALYNNAMFKDSSSIVIGRLSFTQLVTFELGLVVSGRVDGLEIGSLYNFTALTLSGFGSSTAEIKEDYTSMCNSIVSLYDQLEDSLYEGDCFDFVYSEFFPEIRHSSISFNAYGQTFLVLSYENQCYAEVYLWNNVTHTLNFYQSLSETGYVHDWVHIVTEDARIFIAAAGSPTNNQCSDQTSSLWEVFENSIQRVQILSPAETVSKEIVAGKRSLSLHSASYTITYVYDLTQSYWREASRSGAFEISVQALDKKGYSVIFRSNGGIGEVWVGGVVRQTLRLGIAIDDAVLLKIHSQVVLFIIVTVENPLGPIYELRAYEIDYGNLVWLDSTILNTPGELTVFFVGNEACEAVYVAVTQEGQFPVIYNFFGETFSLWTQMVVPGTTWIQHFSSGNSRFPQISDNYLIFGRRDRSALIYKLKMRGSTVPKIENSCVIEDFRRPVLKPIVLI
ncbi:uncharacterized protein [Palaemon carinicauda]|uniref:uncharacterized protein n=1 Tax=Palaemon carinicauda TaxID=392227 RepID=UPI0035B5F6BC